MANKPRKHTRSKVESSGQINPPARSADPLVVRVDPEVNVEVNPEVNPEVDREEVARLAYSYWEARVRSSPEGDWLKAENELKTAAQLQKQNVAARPTQRAVLGRKAERP